MECVIDGRNLARLAGLPTMELRTVHIAAKKVLFVVISKNCSSKLTLVLRASPSRTNFMRKRAIMRMARACTQDEGLVLKE